MHNTDVGAAEYAEFGQFLERQCGIVLGDNKQYLLRSRLMPLVRQYQFESLSTLVKTVINGSDRNLKEHVVDAMTTNETLWFRDVYPFELLANVLLDQFASSTSPVKVWSAACSSGQEPYSIAMVFDEYRRANPRACSAGFEVTATDLSKEMLGNASRAEYDELSLSRGLSLDRRQHYFEAQPNGNWRLRDHARKYVKFRQLNLLDSYSSMGKFNIIFCRNVLIYFSADVKRKILQQIAACMQKDGILFLGASESLSGISHDFELVRCSPGLYYRKKN